MKINTFCRQLMILAWTNKHFLCVLLCQWLVKSRENPQNTWPKTEWGRKLRKSLQITHILFLASLSSWSLGGTTECLWIIVYLESPLFNFYYQYPQPKDVTSKWDAILILHFYVFKHMFYFILKLSLYVWDDMSVCLSVSNVWCTKKMFHLAGY